MYQRILCITRTVEHNHILPSSTIRIQLHISTLYLGRRQVEIQLTDQLYKMCGVFVYLLCKLNHNLKMAHI